MESICRRDQTPDEKKNKKQREKVISREKKYERFDGYECRAKGLKNWNMYLWFNMCYGIYVNNFLRSTHYFTILSRVRCREWFNWVLNEWYLTCTVYTHTQIVWKLLKYSVHLPKIKSVYICQLRTRLLAQQKQMENCLFIIFCVSMVSCKIKTRLFSCAVQNVFT